MIELKSPFPVDSHTKPVSVMFGQIGTTLGQETYLPIKVTDNLDGTCSMEIAVSIDPGSVTIGAVKIEDANSARRLEVVADGEDLSIITNVEGILSLGWDESGDTSRIIRMEQINSKWRLLVDSTLKDGVGNDITSKDETGGVRSLDVNLRSGSLMSQAFSKKVGTHNLTTGGTLTYTTDFAKKKKIVGIYINIDTALARNITISVRDTTAGTDYSFTIKTADSSTQVVINDEFELAVDQEIKIIVTAHATLEDSTILNYRVDCIDMV